MACGLVAINSGTSCVGNEGGVVRSFACNLTDITAITLTSGVISGFTMATTGKWMQLTPEKDQTSYYNQTGTLNGNRFTVESDSFFKFKGLNQAYIDASNNASQCCDIVVIHVLGNGLRLVQGIEIDATATGGFVATKNRSTRIVPTIMSDTKPPQLLGVTCW